MPMEGDNNCSGNKRKRGFSKTLQVNEVVEVRSEEEGLLGSWHRGTVIKCWKLNRHVRYDNFLDDKGGYIVDVVSVSKNSDGDTQSSDWYKRGRIRPLPPLLEFDRAEIKFGLCVDVYYEEAWWEGVIFDHCDGMEKRSVFFPDLGDENVGVDQLRITQDWDEVTQDWKPRGNWVFLELVEEYEREQFVPVSAKQIWYDLRGKNEFSMIGDWTNNNLNKDLWRNLIIDVINEYSNLTIKEILPILNLEAQELVPFKPQEVVPLVASYEEHGCKDWKTVILGRAELCPDAVTQYLLCSKRADRELWMEKLQKHLAYLGWKIEWSDKNNKKRYKYTPPLDNQGSRVYLSLRDVCKALKQKAPNMNDHNNIMHHPLSVVPSHKIQDVDMLPPIPTDPDPPDEVEGKYCPRAAPTDPDPLDEVEGEYCPRAVVKYYHLYRSNRSCVDKKKWISKAKKHLLAEGWTFDYPPEDNKRRGIIYVSPQNRKFPTLHAACKFCMQESVPLNVDRIAANRSTGNKKQKVLPRASKRVQKVSVPSLLHQKPLNVVSWLIGNNRVLPRSKVYYRENGRQHTIKEGRITRKGIECNCCKTIYSLTDFQNHASGSSSCRPSRNIFLEDGRSLLDCQIKLMQDHMTRETSQKSSSDLVREQGDEICSVCRDRDGREVLLCDQCPSVFHKTCVGLKDTPDGDWFCPPCRCWVCGQSKTDGNENGHFLTCSQCEHKYHASCLKNRDVDTSKHLENWFCGKDCERIYYSLHTLLGVPVLVDDLTWTLLKFINSERCDVGSITRDLLAESYSKLNLALSVMHECFVPFEEPFSRDLVEDVIFSRWSELNRLNFKGFYTVLLERNEELISVATVRVYGNKVAELPLVGTRLQYRRHGMCHILINELEKKLKQLGVERLVLPAVPSVVRTWTGSFGFTEMTNNERSRFLDYTFLDFPGTIMCQKLLTIPSPDLVLSIVSPQKCDTFSGSCIVKYQAEEIDEGEMLSQQIGDTCAGNNNDHRNVAIDDPITMVKQPGDEDQQCQNGGSSQHSLVEEESDHYNGRYKCYTRRKRKACELSF